MDPNDGQLPLPPQRNVVLRLYDGPVYADWLAWWTAFWTVFAGLAIVFGDRHATPLPPWADGLLAAVFFGCLLGVIPAWLRLRLRRRATNRRQPGASTLLTPPGGQSAAANLTTLNSPPTATNDVRPIPAERPSTPIRQNAGPPPTPIDILDTRPLVDSSILTEARTRLPHPIARTIRNMQLANSRQSQYEAVIELGENLTVTLGITAVAWLRQAGETTPQLDQLLNAFREQGISQGQWHSLLGQIRALMPKHGEPFTGADQALRPGRRGIGLLSDLRILLEERNRWAHGARPRDPVEAGRRLIDLTPTIESAIDRVSPMSGADWLYVEASSFSRDGSFNVSAQRAMGDHPDFERIQHTSRVPLVDRDIYISSPLGYLNLTPFGVMRYCNTCGRVELCYADRMTKHDGVALKSFSTGHVIFDPSLIPEANALFGDSGTGAFAG